jgi:hypothetical protein
LPAALPYGAAVLSPYCCHTSILRFPCQEIEHGWQKQRSGADRVPVVTLVERRGKARSHRVENVTAATLRGVVFGPADTNSRLMTDELRACRGIGRQFAGHDAVDHGAEELSRNLDDGIKAHTNTVEGFFSLLKRGIYGCYFHVSEDHLHRYLAESDFRYSHRSAVGVEDDERTDRAIKGEADLPNNSWRTVERRRIPVLGHAEMIAGAIRASFGSHSLDGDEQ